MKGIIFNLLEEVIERDFGAEVWDTLLETANLDGIYTSLGNYPDADLAKLVAAAGSVLKRPIDDVLRSFGTAAIPFLATKYPSFFNGHQSTRSFLLTLNDIIHPEVRKLYPGADVPSFTYEITSEQELRMIYQSQRKLCVLAEGFIRGAATHFGEHVVLEQPECMNRGASRCVFHLSFQKRVE